MNIEINKNFYNVDRDKLLYSKSKEKRLSSNTLKYDYSEDKYYETAHKYIIKNFYSLFNFLTDEFTPVLFIDPKTNSSSNSYVENKISLGTKLLLNREYSQQMKIDSMIAIMIHEMWHKKYTNKDILKNYCTNITISEYYDSPEIKKIIKKILPNRIIGDIFNILEDKRIEKLGLKEFPGFVFYFDCLREYCFNLHKNKIVSEYLLSTLVMEYLMFSILIPELLEYYREYVEKIYKLVKIKPKFSKKEMIELFNSIDNYIINNEKKVNSEILTELIFTSKEIYNLFPKKLNDELEKELNNSNKEYNGIFSDYTFDNEKKEDVINEKKLEQIINITNEEIEKLEEKRNLIKEKIEETNKYRIEKIDNCNEKIYKNCVIYNPKCKNIDNIIYMKSKKLSNNITDSLGFISSRLNQINQSFELNEGEIDEDELYSISFSNNIFYNEETKPGFAFDFGILIDESGSMAGEKKNNAIIAALSCILSTKDSKHVNLFVYGHSQGRHKESIEYNIELYEYFNTKRKINNWKNIFSVGAYGGNVDGYAIAKTCEIMLKDSKEKNKILVVISDGLPMGYKYSGIEAEKHVKSIVELFEKKGIEIIQICIDNIENSGNMFKNFIPFDHMGNFIKEFGNILRKKLTKFSEEI